MMKLILVFCFNFILFSAFAQNSYFDIVKPRIDCLPNNKPALQNGEYIVLTKDTLYPKMRLEPNLDFVKSTKERRRIVSRYESQIFRFEDSTSILKQWNSDIVVYLDKQIPKGVSENLMTFYEQINEINNLNILFTSKLKDANYYIKVTSEKVNVYGEDYKFNSEEERLKDIYTCATYRIITDNNYKNYAGVLKINISNSDNEFLLKQLKQMFFISLGQFYKYYGYEETSLLSDKYNNSNTISDNDLELLRMHYAIIYEQKINGNTFKALQKIQKNQR